MGSWKDFKDGRAEGQDEAARRLKLLIIDDEEKILESLTEVFRDRFDVLTYTREKAVYYTRLAGEQLDAVPPSEFCDALKGLTDFVVTRRQ